MPSSRTRLERLERQHRPQQQSGYLPPSRRPSHIPGYTVAEYHAVLELLGNEVPLPAGVSPRIARLYEIARPGFEKDVAETEALMRECGLWYLFEESR